MKKAGILFIAMAAVLMAGCTRQLTPPVMSHPEVNSVETSQQASETPSEQPSEVPSEEWNFLPIDAGYHQNYHPVLDEYLDLLENGYDDEKEYKYVSTGYIERVNSQGKEEMKKITGYKIVDVSGDDIPELLMGENMEFYEKEASYIYAVYTCDKEGQPIESFSGWYRNAYFYDGDGYFIHQGSGGAMYSIFGKGHLKEDGTSLIWDDYYFTYDKEDGSIGFYHNKTGNWDPKASEELHISDEEFWDILKNYPIEVIQWDNLAAFPSLVY